MRLFYRRKIFLLWLAVTSLVTRIFLPNMSIAQALFKRQKLEASRFNFSGSADKQPVREVFFGIFGCGACGVDMYADVEFI